MHPRRSARVGLVSAAELDRTALAVLEDVADAEHLSVILGAGASVPAGLPGWNKLAADLLVTSGAMPDHDTAYAFLAEQDPALAAEAAKAMTDDWQGLVTKALYGKTPATTPLEPAILHMAVAGLAAQRLPHEVGLFTLNFDVLLEAALRRLLADAEGGGEVSARSSSTPTRGAHGHFIVNHLHGVIDPTATGGGSFDDVVLTLKDFTTLASEQYPWQVNVLQQELSSGPMILAGTSYRDPDLRQWLHDLTRGKHTSHHQRVVFLARQGLNLDREQFARVQSALVEQWTSIGITPVLTHDHADAAQAMWELPAIGQPGYLSPQECAQTLLAAHQERFEELQREHSRHLADELEDPKGLRRHLGDSANLTLWLADGHGNLVRWASNDRLYRSPADLRRVPTGYDSPWVAGQCLGREDVVARELAGDGSTRHWLSVVAAPITVELLRGPGFSAAAISSAITTSLDDDLPRHLPGGRDRRAQRHHRALRPRHQRRPPRPDHAQRHHRDRELRRQSYARRRHRTLRHRAH